MKAAAHLKDVLLDPELSFSQEPTETAFNVAIRTELPAWDWFDLEENNFQRIRFGVAMEGSKQAASPIILLEGIIYILR